MATVTVEFSGKIEISTQGWSDETKLEQIKNQAKREVEHWRFLVQKGTLDPAPLPHLKATVTSVTLDI